MQPMSEPPQPPDLPRPSLLPPVPAEAGPQRWSWVRALVAGPLMPARTALATDHLPFWKVLLIHFVALFLIWPITEVDYWLSEPDDGKLVAEHIVEAIRTEMVQGNLPPGAILAIFFALVLAETGLFLAGAFSSPWGGRDERLRTSIWRGLRRALVVGGVWPVCVIIMACVSGYLERLSYDMRLQVQTSGLLTTSLMVWSYWVMLRSVGAGRPGFASPPPPTCAECGYDLSATATDGVCPECAASVANSLSPDSRPGTPWERRTTGTRLESYTATSSQLGMPWLLGRRMRVASDDRHHRAFLLVSLLAAAVLFWAMLSLFFVFQSLPFARHAYLVASLTAAASVLTGGLGMAIFIAGLVGSWLTLRSGRPLLHVAMRAASYAGPLVVVWAALVGVQTWAAETMFRVSVQMAGNMGPLMLVLLYVSCHVLMFAWYAYLTWRITLGAQYATR